MKKILIYLNCLVTTRRTIKTIPLTATFTTADKTILFIGTKLSSNNTTTSPTVIKMSGIKFL